MIKLSSGNILRVTGPLCGNSPVTDVRNCDSQQRWPEKAMKIPTKWEQDALEVLNQSFGALKGDSLARCISRPQWVKLCPRVTFVPVVIRVSSVILDHVYRKISNISRTKSPNLNVSRLVVQLSLPNQTKPGVKSSMKM